MWLKNLHIDQLTMYSDTLFILRFQFRIHFQMYPNISQISQSQLRRQNWICIENSVKIQIGKILSWFTTIFKKRFQSWNSNQNIKRKSKLKLYYWSVLIRWPQFCWNMKMTNFMLLNWNKQFAMKLLNSISNIYEILRN